jgi:peptide deformylase
MLKIEVGENNKILRTKCETVTKFDESLVKTLNEMQETMLYEDPTTGLIGVGLAANQVGIKKRIILITLGVGTKKAGKVLEMINPEILKLSQDEVKMEEGCLSLPNVFEKVIRPSKVKVKWQNLTGNWCERKFEGWDARIFLHEFDHLEGVMFTDYLKKL